MARGARCPTCQSEIAWAGNPYRPFCSLACRLVDLGVWLDERYRIPGPPVESQAPAQPAGANEEAADVP